MENSINSIKKTFKINNKYDLIKGKDYQIVERPISVKLSNEGEKLNITFNIVRFDFYNDGEKCVGTFDPKKNGKNVIIKLSKGKYPLYFYEKKINDFIEYVSKKNKNAKMKIIFKPAVPNRDCLEEYNDPCEESRCLFTDNYFHIEFLNCSDFNASMEKEVCSLSEESEKRKSQEAIFYDNFDEFVKKFEQKLEQKFEQKLEQLDQKVKELEVLLSSSSSNEV